VSSVRFASLCDTCGARSLEYRGWWSCAECVEDVCDSCDCAAGALDPKALCPRCAETPEERKLGPSAGMLIGVALSAGLWGAILGAWVLLSWMMGG